MHTSTKESLHKNPRYIEITPSGIDTNVLIEITPVSDLDFPGSIIVKWQEALDLLASTLNIAGSMITLFHPKEIEVFLSSRTQTNPFEENQTFYYGSRVYCEDTAGLQKLITIDNASEDNYWKFSPFYSCGMVNYAGIPVFWPEKELFGTLCIFNNEPSSFTKIHLNYLRQIRDCFEQDLKIIKYHLYGKEEECKIQDLFKNKD
jgi:transcriptional regulator with GAF, ATPase, and Fis domain